MAETFTAKCVIGGYKRKVYERRKMIAKLKSRKFLVTAASFLFVVLTDIFGVDIEPQTYWAIVGIALSYIAGEAYIDAKNKK